MMEAITAFGFTRMASASADRFEAVREALAEPPVNV
jgi:hypothetical protein